MNLFCARVHVFDIGRVCWDISLFGGDIGLFCVMGLFGADIGLFCGNIGLFCVAVQHINLICVCVHALGICLLCGGNQSLLW